MSEKLKKELTEEAKAALLAEAKCEVDTKDSDEDEDGDEDEDKEEKMVKKEDVATDTKAIAEESVEAMFSGTDTLSEEFRGKAKTIFEAAFNSRMDEAVEQLEEKYQEILAERTVEIEKDMKESVDEYLNMVVKEWVEDNKVALESSIRTSQMESFMNGLRDLFEAHNIDIPEEKVDLYESAQSEIEELKGKVNSLTEAVLEKDKVLLEMKKKDLVDELSEGMTDTQAEKFTKLVESVEATSLEAFKEKAQIVKEGFFKELTKATDTNEVLVEGAEDSKTVKKSSNPYVDGIKRLNSKQ